ncbi:ABC transporter ATP-binding protein [Candidatus Binatia bacterium]|nr:ABC transporter ATP-binding protein [Candidatus Binatia bacterium]
MGERNHVEARGLVKEYTDGPRKVCVLTGIDLTVGAGETVAIIGESGVGKSTLLHLLGGLDRPSSGTVRVGGTDLGALRDRELARFRNDSIGFVFQFHHLLPDFTALENVMMPCLIAGDSPAVARGHALELLERVGLAARVEHRPGELSGGEQQRVAVARAVVRRPALVLADEPTGNLDPDTGSEVERLLVELNHEAGITCVVVTHSPRLAAAMDRTMRLTHGHLEAS